MIHIHPSCTRHLLVALTLSLVSGACTHTQPRVRSSETVARFERADFLESVTVAEDGTFFIHALRPSGDTQILRVRPGQAPEVFASLPNVGTVVAAPQGGLYATVVKFGNKRNAPGVWRVEPDGKASPLVELPEGAFPNGITLDSQGNLFVADSALSTVWRIPAGAKAAEPWLQHPLLAPAADKPGYPGANGIKLWKGSLYVTNSSQDTLVRVPVGAEGKPAEPSIHARVQGPDDFAIDEQGGMYVTQHVLNSLSYVPPPGGEARVLAGKEANLWGPTSAAFGRRAGDETALYVVMDGNWFAQLLAAQAGGKAETYESLLLRFDVGIRGAPLR